MLAGKAQRSTLLSFQPITFLPKALASAATLAAMGRIVIGHAVGYLVGFEVASRLDAKLLGVSRAMRQSIHK